MASFVQHISLSCGIVWATGPVVGIAPASMTPHDLAEGSRHFLFVRNLTRITFALRTSHFGLPSDNEVADYSIEFKLGLTFWLVVAGLVLALFTSVVLLMSAKHAGNGPFNGFRCFWTATGFAWLILPFAVRNISGVVIIVSVELLCVCCLDGSSLAPSLVSCATCYATHNVFEC